MRRGTTSAAAALVGALAVSGCRGGTGGVGIATAGGNATPSASASPAASLSPEDAALKFAQCMRRHGVDMPDPKFGSGGQFTVAINGNAPPQVVQKAQKACQQYMPMGGTGPGKLSAADQERALKFAQCMREHGVDMPDPTFSGGGVQMRVGGPPQSGSSGRAFGPNDPTFKKAQQACRKYFGGGPGGFSISGGSQ
jgi:hypothetical protein